MLACFLCLPFSDVYIVVVSAIDKDGLKGREEKKKLRDLEVSSLVRIVFIGAARVYWVIQFHWHYGSTCDIVRI